jgi:hypothetical protein
VSDVAERLLISVELSPSDASVEGAARVLGVPVDSIDRDYGVVEVNPRRQRYALRIAAGALPSGSGSVASVHADPGIRAFG